MLVIQDILISDDIIEEKFFCDLNVCKGACCTEGDYGAPVEPEEMDTINTYLDIIIENLPEKSKTLLHSSDGFTFYKNPGVWGTTCHEDGACVFLTKNELGISVCGIEKTWYEENVKNIIQDFKVQYNHRYLTMMKSKLGLFDIRDGDDGLIFNLEQMLRVTEIDMTIFFRKLVQIQFNINDHRMFEIIHPALYAEVLEPDVKTKIILWLTQYRERLKSETETPEARIKKMNEVNPKYVLRNYIAQMAIDEAEKGNYHLVYEMYEMLKKPYDKQPEFEKWFARRPDWARKKVGCSMLSCSS